MFAGGHLMRYVKWTGLDIEGLDSIAEITVLYTEIDDNGDIIRELGMNKNGTIVHKFPSHSGKYGKYGVFDGQKVIVSDLHSDISKEDFDRMWEMEEKN
jgi:hypothetical protein